MGVPGCSGLFRGVFRGCSGVFRGVPGFTDTRIQTHSRIKDITASSGVATTLLVRRWFQYFDDLNKWLICRAEKCLEGRTLKLVLDQTASLPKDLNLEMFPVLLQMRQNSKKYIIFSQTLRKTVLPSTIQI